MKNYNEGIITIVEPVLDFAPITVVKPVLDFNPISTVRRPKDLSFGR